MLLVSIVTWLSLTPAATARRAMRRPTRAEKIVKAAEFYLGTEYNFGGRMGQRRCRVNGRRAACAGGLDCQSLIFFAYQQVLGRHWTRFSTTPSINIKRKELGQPVPGMKAVMRSQLNPKNLRRGDVLFFLLQDYNLENDVALYTHQGRQYGTWHTGLFHGFDGQRYNVIHAKPGDKVVIEPIESIEFDALYVIRLR